MQVLSEYLAYAKMSNLSFTTLKEYNRVLGKFTEMLNLKEKEDFEQLSSSDVINFIEKLKNSSNTIELKPSTINAYMRYLKSFNNYLIDQEIIDTNFMKNVPKIKEQKKEVVIYNHKEIDSMRSVVKKEQDKLIFNMMLQCGLRRNEVCEFKVKDINEETMSIFVLGKGNKYREVPVQKRFLKQLLFFCNINNRKEGDLLFQTCHGNQIHPSSLNKKINNWQKKAKVIKTVGGVDRGCHTFRKTCANIWLEQGMDIRTISKLLGHSDIEVTMRYVKWNRNRAVNTINKISYDDLTID
jgi:site-specific recombinase XerD